jgi:hypothetical protein
VRTDRGVPFFVCGYFFFRQNKPEKVFEKNTPLEITPDNPFFSGALRKKHEVVNFKTNHKQIPIEPKLEYARKI